MNYDLHSPFTAPTSEEIAEADERADIERANRWVPILGWAIGAVAVFGCMSFAWWKA